EVALLVTGRDEGDEAAVGRPGGRGVVKLTVGQLLRLARLRVDDKEMAAAVEGETVAVHLVLELRNHAGRRVLRLLLESIGPTGADDHDDTAAIGRPGG